MNDPEVLSVALINTGKQRAWQEREHRPRLTFASVDMHSRF